MAGSFAEAELVADRALAMAKDLGLEDIAAEALNNRGLARTDVGDVRGLDDLERSIELGRAAGSPIDVMRGLGNLSSVLASAGDLRRAAELNRAGLDEAERFGIEAPMAWLSGEAVEFAYHAGQWDAALSLADEWLAERARRGAPHFIAFAVLGNRALVRAARGDEAGALADDERQLELAREQDRQVVRHSRAMSAYVRALARRSAEAERRLDELLAEWHAEPQSNQFLPHLLAFTAAAVGRTESFLEVARDVRATAWLEAATAFARGAYAEAGDRFDEIGSLPSGAYARLHAPETLEQALAFYRSVGATLFVRRGEELLAAAG
jgi:ATP/maltotriose-dependent transcriptional regulator MalT